MTNPINFLSINAIRVPPIQFQSYVGNPPHLVTSDILTGCGGISLPGPLAQIMQMLQNGTAYVDAIANSAINQVNATIGAVTGQVTGLIASATASLSIGVAQLTAQASAIGGAIGASITSFIGSTTSGVNAVIGQHSVLIDGMGNPMIGTMSDGISNIVGNMPATANMLSNVGQLHASLGMSALPSLNSIFDPVVNGGLNSTLAPVLSATNAIQAAVGGTIITAQSALFSAMQSVINAGMAVTGAIISAAGSAISAAVSTITSSVGAVAGALGSAVSSVSGAVIGLVAGMNAAISNALSTLTHVVSAAALSVLCAGATEFNGFLNSITTPAFQALLPPPT
jgi:phage-related protein